LTQQILHMSRRQRECLSQRLHIQGLMGPLVVLVLDPVANDTTGVLQGFKAMRLNTLLP
jgi:hypothetical protein